MVSRLPSVHSGSVAKYPREHVQHAFDVKIDEMCELLDGQIQRMQTKYPHDRIVSFISL